MIDRQEAERIASEWARQETRRIGQECAATLDEFDAGYMLHRGGPVGPRALPDDGVVTVIDKETGTLTSWPGLPAPLVRRVYLEDQAGHAGAHRTVCPAATPEAGPEAGPETSPGAGSEAAGGGYATGSGRRAARSARRRRPAAAARLTVQHEQHVAYGARGDVALRHHPLLRDHLSSRPAGWLVRGGDRHAELVVLSDALHEHDRRHAAAGQPPLTHESARELLSSAHLEVFRVREPDDPAGGVAERPCDSCVQVLVHFGVLPWAYLAFAEEWRPNPQPVPEPGRFPLEVGLVLAEGGWRPGFGDALLARETIARVCEVSGRRHRHRSFPAAERTLTAFPGLVCNRRGAGERVWIRRFEINPMAVAHSADTLAGFGSLLGVGLFPIGAEGEESILAVDELGRVFALDQAGEWFLGADIDTALTNLLLGRDVARVRDDGTW